MTRVATCVESAGRSIASRISGNAGSTVSIPSAVSAVAIEMVMVNAAVPGWKVRRPSREPQRTRGSVAVVAATSR